jgi:CO dehydrogenase maturation factor
MAYVIAMAGKGGTGKTTVAALMIRLLKEKNAGSILAIDADPNSNLGEILGIEYNDSVGSILDDIAEHPDKVPGGMSKDRYIEYRIQTAIAEGAGFDLLTMGKPEGPGCYCYVNNALRGVMQKLIDAYNYVIIDNEAGLEHLSRRTTRACDTLLVVSDSSKVGLLSAKRIDQLARDLDIKVKKRLLLVNRSGKVQLNDLKIDAKLECLGTIPEDREIEKIAFKGESVMALPEGTSSLAEMRKLGEKIWSS